MLMTAGIHALDQLIWLMDGRVGSVSATAGTEFHDQKADDSAMMLLRFNDGRYGHGVQDGGIRVSLLRAAKYPDPTQDHGRHSVTIGLLPLATAIFGVLRRRELLALLVDWGYRSDGIPVTLFGAWTTLPAGPATLAAKTKSLIVPIIATRQPDGRLRVAWAGPIAVPSAVGSPGVISLIAATMRSWMGLPLPAVLFANVQ